VTNTQGHDFEDYFLKRELLMGVSLPRFERRAAPPLPPRRAAPASPPRRAAPATARRPPRPLEIKPTRPRINI